MTQSKDIALENFDLKIVNGDFVISDSDTTHIEHILLATKGTYKASPVTGVGILQNIKGPSTPRQTASFVRKLIAQLEYDGYSDVQVNTKNGIGKLTIDAQRV